jgi:hypothetical protein
LPELHCLRLLLVASLHHIPRACCMQRQSAQHNHTTRIGVSGTGTVPVGDQAGCTESRCSQPSLSCGTPAPDGQALGSLLIGSRCIPSCLVSEGSRRSSVGPGPCPLAGHWTTFLEGHSACPCLCPWSSSPCLCRSLSEGFAGRTPGCPGRRKAVHMAGIACLWYRYRGEQVE